MSHNSREKNVPSDICTQRKLKSACASVQSDQSLCCPRKETLPSWLSKMRPVKILIRLCECGGCSESSLSVIFFLKYVSDVSRPTLSIQVNGKRGPGRPKMTWKQLTERDCREWKLSAINPHDRHSWRSGVRSAMCAASQLSGRGPTDVDVAPVPAR